MTVGIETLRTWALRARGLDRAAFAQQHPSPLLVLLDPLFGGGRGGAEGALATSRQTPIGPRSARSDALALPPDAPVFAVEKRPGGNPHPGMVTIGRASNNDLVIPSQAISNFHAWASRDHAGNWTIRDARSSNGTTVGGQRVEAAGLPLGDDALVGLGHVRCRFMTPAAFHTIVRAAGW